MRYLRPRVDQNVSGSLFCVQGRVEIVQGSEACELVDIIGLGKLCQL